MIEGILLAMMYLGIGCFLLLGAWFGLKMLWITFGPVPREKWHRTSDGGMELR